MQNQYIIVTQERFLIEGAPLPQIQNQYQSQIPNQIQQQNYILTQNQQIPQYQAQILNLVPDNQHNSNNIIIDDSNFCSEMCCLLVWVIIVLILSIGNILMFSGYYLLINLIVFIGAILIICSICSKNLSTYKYGYICYNIYAVLIIISHLLAFLLVNIFGKEKFLEILDKFGSSAIQQEYLVEIFISPLIIICMVLPLEMCMFCFVSFYLKNKMNVFISYYNYKRRQNALIL